MDDVSIELWSGEVHALVGENGAGKSTLINVLSGVLQPDRGTVLLNGVPRHQSSPIECRLQGIVTVHQEADHFRDLTVAENMAMFYGLPLTRWRLVDWPRVFADARTSVARMGEPIDVRQPAKRLSIGQLHMTQVAAAVACRARVLILDEPTSALSDVESEWLFDQIDRLRDAGCAVLYISHRQEEIFRLADRITVLRDGRSVWHGTGAETNRAHLVESMVGRSVEVNRKTTTAGSPGVDAAVCLAVSGLTDRQGRFTDISFAVRSGEIVGVYGLIGAGRSEVAQAIFGHRALRGGSIFVKGQRITITSPEQAVEAGLAYVPEDRLRQALCRSLSIRANAVLASLRRLGTGPFVSARRERSAAGEIVQQLSVKHRSVEQSVSDLSGGNQQKVVLARWLLTKPDVMILDEPTRGVDVGAKEEIHAILSELAATGCGLLMISSELPEVMRYSDRILVFRQGEVSAEFDADEVTAEQVAAAALPEEVKRVAVSKARLAKSTNSQPPSPPRIRRSIPTELPLAMLVVALAAWTAMTSEGFNLTTLLTNASLWSLLGLAAASVIIAGGIDISIGSLVALSAASCAIAIRLPGPPFLIVPFGIAVGVITGGLGGLVNAAISLTGRVHPIVVTLGTMTIYRGLVIALLGGKSVTGLPVEFVRLAHDPATGFRGTVATSVVVVLAVAVWLNYGRAGRHLYAIGSGPQAARLAGIGKSRTWLMAFGLGGVLAGLVGVLQLAESGQMQSRLAVGWELHAIAVAVIGGVAITGGRGSVTGVVLGAVLIRLINGSLVRWGIRDVQFDLFVGGMILAAVLIDRIWQRQNDKN